MAYLNPINAAPSFGETVKAVFKAIGGFFASVSIAQSRAELFEEMSNLTDVELANKYNICRDQIVQYVFRDKLF